MSDFEWHRSSFCASGACVDVRRDGDTIVVRDGKLGDRSIEQTFSLERWPQLLSALANGEDHPDVLADDDGCVRLGRVMPLIFTADEWTAFVAGVKNGEFEIERLSSGEAGSDTGVRSGQNAATGAGAIAVPPVPVAAQPRYILDKDAILELVIRYAVARIAADRAYFRTETERRAAKATADDLLDAIRGALTPVPDVEPEPAWGSGPLVKHVTETPAVSRQRGTADRSAVGEADPAPETPGTGSAEPQMPYLTGQPVSFVDDGDGQAVQR